jgi:oxalate decarboxylase/phosphoglucose isomerase-like protein (cupin superfamily)
MRCDVGDVMIVPEMWGHGVLNIQVRACLVR